MNPDSDQPSETALGLSGQIQELAFDDEPIESIVYETSAVAPTPANVICLWSQNLERSAACASAVAATIVRGRSTICATTELQSAEECLRLVLKNNALGDCATRVSHLLTLGIVLKVTERQDEAETFFRNAVAESEAGLGRAHKLTFESLEELLPILVAKGEDHEVLMIRQTLSTRVADDGSSNWLLTDSWRLRQKALTDFNAGRFVMAENAYMKLVARGFEPGSTYCHLVRLYLMEGREAEAAKALQAAEQSRESSPPYVCSRIVFLKVLLGLGAGQDCSAEIRKLKESLEVGGSANSWTILPAVECYKDRIKAKDYELLSAVSRFINGEIMCSELMW